jgi:hypothetical protein
MSVFKPWATVGRDMRKILAESPARKFPSMALMSRSQSMRAAN